MKRSPSDPTVSVRQQLAQEDWYMSRPTREWLERTRPEQAADLLAQIAEDARPEPHSLALQFLAGLLAVFATSENLSGGVVARRVGTRAALMLANLGDFRSLPPLVRVFEANPVWQGKYQELVETSLTRFLTNAVGRTDLRNYESEIRTLIKRAWKSGRGEVSSELADLLIAALRCLNALGGEDNLAVLRSLATSHTNKPHRLRVIESARALRA